MGPVVEDVAKVSIKRVNVVKPWKLIQHTCQFVMPGLLGELDLSHVELPYPVDAPPRVTLGRRFALRAGQDNVDEVLRRGHWRDPFEVVQRHVSSYLSVRFVFSLSLSLSVPGQDRVGSGARSKGKGRSVPGALFGHSLGNEREKVAKMFPPFLRCVYANTSLCPIVLVFMETTCFFLTALSAIQSSIRLDYEHWYLYRLFDRMMLRPCYYGGNSPLSVLSA